MADPMVDVLLQAALRNFDTDTVEAFNTAYNFNSLINICPVTDVDGNPLEKDKIYETPNGKVWITSWEFGPSNMTHTYYRVSYLDKNLKDGMKVINAKHKKDMSRIYPTNWKLVV